MVEREQRNSKNCFLDSIILNSWVHIKYDNMMVSGATNLSYYCQENSENIPEIQG